MLINSSLSNLKPHDHVCFLYETPDEWRDTVIPFLLAGLESNKKCLYVKGFHSQEYICSCLEDEEIDVSSVLESGQLMILHPNDLYIQEDRIDPYQAIVFLMNEVKKSLKEGYDSIRFTAEMGWILGLNIPQELIIEFEARLNKYFFSKYPCTALCQYDLAQYDPFIFKDIIRNHPLVARKKQVYQNPWYIPPSAFLSRYGGNFEVQYLLNNIEQECKFKDQAQFFINALEGSAQPFLASYPNGNIMRCNLAFRELTGYTELELNTMIWGKDLTPPEFNALETTLLEELYRTGIPQRYEKQIISSQGTRIPVELLAHRVCDNKGIVQYYYTFVTDISERKRMEEELKYLSLHDSLTGLYNRTFFEQEMLRIEELQLVDIGLIICDVDGLKLVNDTLGHDKGDDFLIKAANILRECFQNGEIITRIGGDEFVILLFDTSKAAVKKAINEVRACMARTQTDREGLQLNMSIGFAVSHDKVENAGDLFKEADNYMYREKLLHSQSTRSAITQILRKTMEARDFITEEHAERLLKTISFVTNAAGLSENAINDLQLLAEFHDIGKMGIPDSILLKAGPLTDEERIIMQRHSGIGHRIAISSPDLAPIAEWILKHHEWWNGQGYPLGLAEDQIPLECRILAIVDAYDAMTNDRPYRKAMTHKDALIELNRCAGTQFDPLLVEKFNRILGPESNNQLTQLYYYN